MDKRIKQQIAESFVFVNEDYQHLQFQAVIKGSMRLRSHADEVHKDVVLYVEGQDYKVDYDNGRIARIAGGRILNWSEHALYGVVNFDHTKYESVSNSAYTVYGDYEYLQNEEEQARPELSKDEDDKLSSIKQKLANGQEVTYVVYGDSISTGGEASESKYAYFSRFAAQLEAIYPKGSFRILNKAIGGEASDGGAKRVIEDVVSLSPDLVTIGYGMNDQNKYDGGYGVSLEDYEHNIRFIIESIQSSGDAAIVLVTPCHPNPLWQHTSGRMGEYAEVLRRLADVYNIGVADAYTVWQHALDAGKTPESLLLNNINHPNDYGHWLYYTAFEPLIR